MADVIEECAVSARRLCVAEKEVSPVLERIMKEGQAFLLSLVFKVYQEIAADDQVQSRKRRVGEEILFGEYNVFPYISCYG